MDLGPGAQDVGAGEEELGGTEAGGAGVAGLRGHRCSFVRKPRDGEVWNSGAGF